MKYYFTILALAYCLNTFAQNDQILVKTTINDFFEGMRSSDSTILRNNLASKVIFQTISASNEIKNQNVADFLVSVSKAPKGALDEKISFKSIQIDGNLASVWTPYRFYYNGTFSHCGVNSFQLHKENGSWKIQYIIDTRRKDDCVE